MPVETITFWHWWALAGALMLIELFGLGFFFLWVGASAALVGLALLGWAGMPVNVQFGLFCGLSLCCMAAWRHVRATREMHVSQPHHGAELESGRTW